jgi:membrane protease YdiL (CAAX protease family)
MSSANVKESTFESGDTLPGNGALAAWEIASVTSSVLIAEWILSAAAGRSKTIVAIPITLAFVLMIGSHRLREEGLRDLGFRFDNFFRALKILLVPMIAVTTVSFLFGVWSGTRPDFLRWHAERPIAGQLALGLGWGFVQQYVLQAFVNRRAQIIWGPGVVSVLLTSLVFAALHLPNPWLMVVTLVGGLVWATAYQRAPNLFALALSHSVMTWVLVSTLPVSALNHLRIGFKYFA